MTAGPGLRRAVLRPGTTAATARRRAIRHPAIRHRAGTRRRPAGPRPPVVAGARAEAAA